MTLQAQTSNVAPTVTFAILSLASAWSVLQVFSLLMIAASSHPRANISVVSPVEMVASRAMKQQGVVRIAMRLTTSPCIRLIQTQRPTDALILLTCVTWLALIATGADYSHLLQGSQESAQPVKKVSMLLVQVHATNVPHYARTALPSLVAAHLA
jgi:hypothetical protein